MSSSKNVISLSEYRLKLLLKKVNCFILTCDPHGAIKPCLHHLRRFPTDLKIRQQLADLYSRTGQVEKAYSQYMDAAHGFTEVGLFSEARVIYKKLQELDPEDTELFHCCAELSMRQGAVTDALSEYRQLLQLYQEQGDTEDVLEMQELIERLLVKS